MIDGSEGRGLTFDWNLARSVTRPFVLAGGLSPLNIEEAILKARPHGVDVTSGVERVPGVKDPQKVARFIELARRC